VCVCVCVCVCRESERERREREVKKDHLMYVCVRARVYTHIEVKMDHLVLLFIEVLEARKDLHDGKEEFQLV
jgi:hypothetical protein